MFAPGTDVMAPWGDGYLYAAVVVRPDVDEPDHVVVAFWEGGSETVKVRSLRACELDVGAKVEVDYLGHNSYEAGRIEQRLGGAIQVALKNGSTVWTTWAKCRVKKQKKPK
jgi:hypothetical protein